MQQRKYGWRRDRPGNYPQLVYTEGLAGLPAAVDLRPMCGPVLDQGQIGSCTANGIAGALAFLQIKRRQPLVSASRLFIYWNERALEGDTNQDAGAQIADGVAAIAKWGAAPEAMWPYDPALLYQCPSSECYGDAWNRKELAAAKLDNANLDGLLQCLASGFPFVFGVSVYESFESQKVAATGIVPWPLQGEQLLGGHCMLCVGYDLAKRQFIWRNSWGENWGLSGYCLAPFEYLTNRNLASDFWTLR